MNSFTFKKEAFCNLALVGLLFSADQGTIHQPTPAAFTQLPNVDARVQLDHALELMASEQYSKILATESSQDQREIILDLVKRSLPLAQKSFAIEISTAVINEANFHGMDPFFLLSIISHESQFDRKARGSHGEIGLMQILPSTAKWLSLRLGLNSEADLEDPSTNVRLGAAYLSQLRKSFKRQGNRYMAAYNMGSRNVRRLLASSTEPTVYPDKVMTIYNSYYDFLARLNVRPYQQTASN